MSIEYVPQSCLIATPVRQQITPLTTCTLTDLSPPVDNLESLTTTPNALSTARVDFFVNARGLATTPAPEPATFPTSWMQAASLDDDTFPGTYPADADMAAGKVTATPATVDAPASSADIDAAANQKLDHADMLESFTPATHTDDKAQVTDDDPVLPPPTASDELLNVDIREYNQNPAFQQDVYYMEETIPTFQEVPLGTGGQVRHHQEALLPKWAGCGTAGRPFLDVVVYI
ncbi:hypothetical protein SARC_03294 [Sphaeroforma arctica JP610]|uniref:Uncharacterized protein n=1 Tax=Sphaeroforma arctica JP610 TaxID=667725 RepID=A0A0L0G6B7_9EUKA|nr:hypothetical protein SARC_03294 [Sphaeroforma arctica JP610]KNC84489.1 hypothetical protein SARC_03294 [Sphaeroforma arctica JP610]|eukprot:XP_014158391.1 hypothetical protein SARC_03294 [Sphaeroforma arctica JP610]